MGALEMGQHHQLLVHRYIDLPSLVLSISTSRVVAPKHLQLNSALGFHILGCMIYFGGVLSW